MTLPIHVLFQEDRNMKKITINELKVTLFHAEVTQYGIKFEKCVVKSLSA